jgi:integration host factor subunit beta
MTKSELSATMAQRYPHYARQEIEALVTAVFAVLAQALAAGERIELRGFGSFGVKQHRPRAARNPRTGARLAVPAKIVPFFRVAKELHKRIQGTGTSAEPG